MKIAICEFHQETNSFNSKPSGRRDYEMFGIWKGQEMIDKGHGPSALGAMLDVLEKEDVEIVPTYRMWANAAGPVEEEVVNEFMDNVKEMLTEALPLDGVLLSLHGATQSTVSYDVCGDILTMVRDLVGDDTFLAATTDLHCNVTDLMQEKADIICGYHTYPHVDFYETGTRATNLMLKKLKGEVKDMIMLRTKIPFIVSASVSNTVTSAFCSVIAKGDELVNSGKILDYTAYSMTPWLDVPEGGAAVLTISETDDDTCINEITQQYFSIIKDLQPDLVEAEDIIKKAEANDSGKPIVLVDAADSPNAGAAGDSSYVLSEIVRLGSDVKAAISVVDLAAAQKAFEVGVGNTAEFTIGASINPELSDPVTVTAYVRSLHDGEYTQEGPAKRGLVHHMGPTAVLRVGNTDVIVAEYVFGPGDVGLYRAHGIDPTMYQLVAVKACTSYRAAYTPIALDMIEGDNPGSASTNLFKLPFKMIPKTHYPFSEITYDQVMQPKRLR